MTTAPNTEAPDLVHAEPTSLETGWLITTPPGDNIILDSVRAMAEGYATLHEAVGHRVFRCPDGEITVTDSGSPSPFGNLAHLLQPGGSATELAGFLNSFYGQSPGGPYLVFSPWPTGDLSSIGLALVGHPPLMVRWTPTPGPHADLVIRGASTPRDVVDFERMLVEGYPVRELWPFEPGQLMTAAVLDTPWKLFIGYSDDRPVACAASYTDARVTLIEMVATLPEHRGRGHGAAMTHAAAGGHVDRPAVLIASDDGQGVYDQLGFRRITRFTLWLGQRD